MSDGGGTQRPGSTRVEHTARARGGAGSAAAVLAFLMEGVPEHLRGAVSQVAENLPAAADASPHPRAVPAAAGEG